MRMHNQLNMIMTGIMVLWCSHHHWDFRMAGFVMIIPQWETPTVKAVQSHSIMGIPQKGPSK